MQAIPTRRQRAIMVTAALCGLAIASGAGAGAGVMAQDADEANLPVNNITLYRSGVGYFERAGLIDGSATVQLRFNTDQINDILKSMVLLDLDGGMIEAASYGSKEPLARRLASFAVDISDNPPMWELLNRLRGARVSVGTLEGETAGVVVGVEKRQVPVKDGGTVAQPFVNLLTDSGIESVNLARVNGMQILDDKLARELSKALAALAEHQADNTKTVDLSFKGDGARRIVVAYVHEMPVWKTSYRLVLSESGEPTLQGWAIVENTTDEDWDAVSLSLVAGQPVGFQMDLYQPLFLRRPMIPVPVTAGVMPKAYEGEAVDWDKVQSQLFEDSGSPRSRRTAGGLGRQSLSYSSKSLIDRSDLSVSGDAMANYAPSAQATAGEVGEVFQYKLDQPVTIERRRSAMLPILSSAIEGRRVSIYNRNDGRTHPMRGVDIKNTSGLQLMPGPISVFDEAAYAGDAQIAHVAAGDERLLAYAVDLQVLVNTKDEYNTNLTSLRIVNGVVEETRKARQSVKYTFKNSDEKRDRTMVIEHTKMGGWDLVKPSEPKSQTQTAYRFEVEVEAGGAAGLEVVLERIDRQSIAVTSYNMKTLLAYASQGKASDAVVKAVREAGRLQALVRETTNKITAIEKERSEIASDQKRVRENMGRIDRNTELYARYIRKLDTQETRLEQIVTELESLRAEKDQRTKALNDYINHLNVK
jgi:hypothetical protein